MRERGPTQRDEAIEGLERDLAALRVLVDRVVADLDDRVRRLEDPSTDGDARPAGQGQ